MAELQLADEKNPEMHTREGVPFFRWYAGINEGSKMLNWDLFKCLPNWKDQEVMEYESYTDAMNALAAARKKLKESADG